MDVTVDPDVPLLILCESLEQVFYVIDFGVELKVRVNPLAVQVDSSYRIAVVTTDHSVRIQDRNEHKRVELAQELCLLPVGAQEIKDAFENGTGRGLTTVHTRRDYYVRLTLQIL